MKRFRLYVIAQQDKLYAASMTGAYDQKLP